MGAYSEETEMMASELWGGASSSELSFVILVITLHSPIGFSLSLSLSLFFLCSVSLLLLILPTNYDMAIHVEISGFLLINVRVSS